MLRPIDEAGLDDAVAVLGRGFPRHAPAFWRAGLARLGEHHRAAGLGPLGFLLHRGDEPAGVILTMRSRRPEAGPGEPAAVVNLSSWYVDDRHRFLAPRMLQEVLAEPCVTFTDLTPNPPVRQLIGRLGFTPWSEGTMVVPLPLAALRPARASLRLWREDAAGAALPAAAMLADHARLGAIPAVLEDGEGPHPLVFLRILRRGIPSARLVYADDRRRVLREIGALARFLIRQGILFVEIAASAQDRMAGSVFLSRSPPTFFRGNMPPHRIDHAYSEFVFLKI